MTLRKILPVESRWKQEEKCIVNYMEANAMAATKLTAMGKFVSKCDLALV